MPRRPAPSTPPPPSAPALAAGHDTDRARYEAFVAHDARFDGLFVVGVTSTGIYCRPVCRVRPPRPANCRFFDLPAQAEAQGFRPCLRCRPELAPLNRHWSGQDAVTLLARQALDLLHRPDALPLHTQALLPALAQRLGVTPRHVHRVFTRALGISPAQYWQTLRLLRAKQLLADTQLPMPTVAELAGFESVRRFNAALSTHYRLTPTQLRRQTATDATTAPAFTLSYRLPYDVNALLTVLAACAVPGVEHVDRPSHTLTRAMAPDEGWVQLRFDAQRPVVHLRVGTALLPLLPQVLWQVRTWLDLDADPLALPAWLDGPGWRGTRVPGAPDTFAWSVQVLLQATPANAGTGMPLLARLVARWGAAAHTPSPHVVQAFPTAATLARLTVAELTDCGLTEPAAQTLLALAVLATQLDNPLLQPDTRPTAQTDALQRLAHLFSAHGLAAPETAIQMASRVTLRAWQAPDVDDPAPMPPDPLHALESFATPLGIRPGTACRPWRSLLTMRNWQNYTIHSKQCIPIKR